MAQTIREILGLNIGQNLKEHRTYRIWAGMRNRCRVNHEAADRYFFKKIRVCKRWDSFLLFLEDMGHPPTDAYSIDRIDTNGQYEPGNCRWADKQTQSENKRNVKLYALGALKLTVKKMAFAHGLNYHTLRWRLAHGLTMSQALSHQKHQPI